LTFPFFFFNLFLALIGALWLTILRGIAASYIEIRLFLAELLGLANASPAETSIFTSLSRCEKRAVVDETESSIFLIKIIEV